MKKIILFGVIVLCGAASAQSLPEFSEFMPGEKLTYQTKASGKTSKYEFVFAEVNSSTTRGTVSIDGKQMEFESPAHGYLGKEFCLADVMECEWTPPVKMFTKDSKLGDKWSATTTVKMKNNTVVDETIESKVEKFEKIKVPAGEFEAFRVSSTGSIKAKVEKGDVYTGTLKMTTWFGVVNKRLVLIKRDYTNSFRQPFTQELSKLPE